MTRQKLDGPADQYAVDAAAAAPHARRPAEDAIRQAMAKPDATPPASTLPQNLVWRLAVELRREAFSGTPGSDDWKAMAAYRAHCLKKAPALLRAIAAPTAKMIEAGLALLLDKYESADAEDARQLWTIMVAVAAEEEAERKRQAAAGG